MDYYIPPSQIEAQKKYLYGTIIKCLSLSELQDPNLDAHIQTIINQFFGMNKLFNYQPEVLTIIGYLETARKHDAQFRKSILDAANLVKELKGGGSDA